MYIKHNNYLIYTPNPFIKEHSIFFLSGSGGVVESITLLLMLSSYLQTPVLDFPAVRRNAS